MTAAGTVLKGTVVTCAITIASGFNAYCPIGTRVYSLSVWSGFWLDGLVVRCTGDSDEQYIPEEFNDHPGGEEDADICAGTAGVQSIHWNVQDGIYGLFYLNITCLDNQTYQFADGQPYVYWNVSGNRTISCDEEEYVQGLTYSLDYVDNSSYTYFLTDLDFICSTSTLDPICTNCRGDTALLSDQDQPEYCELPSCSQAECCESKVDEEAESADEEAYSFTMIAIIAVVFTVTALIVISECASTFIKRKKKKLNDKKMERFRSVEASRELNGPAYTP